MSLVKPNKVYLPPLHIELGLVKNFVKAVIQHREAFKRVCELFPYKFEVKLKQEIFLKPQIRKLLKDQLFETKLTPNELAAWNAFELVLLTFLEKHKSTDYQEIVGKMSLAYKIWVLIECHLKMHFLHSHLEFFSENNGDVSD